MRPARLQLSDHEKKMHGSPTVVTALVHGGSPRFYKAVEFMDVPWNEILI